MSTADAIVRAFCFVGRQMDVYFRLRPFLPDPADEFLLELAVAGHADAGAQLFGIRVMTPGKFLRTIEE